MKRILCYGDSNTWGYTPGTGLRYADGERWTGRAAALLGEEYNIIEDGLNGRTTTFDDYYVDCRNGKKGLGYALCAAAPIDLIVISLGTNDLKYTGAVGSYKGLDELLRMIYNADACFPAAGCPIFPNGVKALVVSPIHLYPEIARLRPESSIFDKYGESLKFAGHYEQIAKKHGAYFLDAALYAAPSPIDCVHMPPEAHAALAAAVAGKINEIFR